MQPSKEDILNMYRTATIKDGRSIEHYESDKWLEGKALHSHKWLHCAGGMKIGDRVLYQIRDDEPGLVTILHISRKEFPIPTVIDRKYIQLTEG